MRSTMGSDERLLHLRSLRTPCIRGKWHMFLFAQWKLIHGILFIRRDWSSFVFTIWTRVTDFAHFRRQSKFSRNEAANFSCLLDRLQFGTAIWWEQMGFTKRLFSLRFERAMDQCSSNRLWFQWHGGSIHFRRIILWICREISTTTPTDLLWRTATATDVSAASQCEIT